MWKTKCLLFYLRVIILILCTAKSISQTISEEPNESSTIPVVSEEEFDQNETELLQSNDPRHVAFYLYPNPNNMTDNDVLILDDAESLSTSRYNISNPPIFIIHGFLNNYTTWHSRTVKNELLKNGFSTIHNIIVVDWGKLATPANLTAWLSQIHDPLKDLYYKASVNNVPKVGSVISQFISFLVTEQCLDSPANVTLLGFSLGAQISGFAGAFLKGKIGRITGLDPAGPLYQTAGVNSRLDASDAIVVHIVHSNQGQAGYQGTAGTADFYPNGGGPNQPDCIGFDVINTISGSCAHNRAWIYYLKALTENITACKCISYADLICRAFCTNKVRFGYYSPSTAAGSYYFDISVKDQFEHE